MTMDEVFLGMRVTTSFHREATLWTIKRIDSEGEFVFLVGDDECYGWVSVGRVDRPSQYQLNRSA